jgi:ribosomal protein S18 acetylase RimI-like enzyme
MLSIRLASEADIDAVIGIAPAGTERRQAIAEWVHAGECHVAWRGEFAAGYVVLTRSFFRSPFIEMLVVSPAARRQGIGRALIERCIALAPPGEKLWTSTNESNTPMRALLPRLGFVQTGMFEHLDPGDPELIFLRWPAGVGPG